MWTRPTSADVIVRLDSRGSDQQLLQLFAEPLQFVETLFGGFDNLGLRLEDPAALMLGQYAQYFAHFPSRRADGGQPRGSRCKQGNAVPFHHTDGFWKTIERLQFETS